jgi:hypothetical protein
VSLNLTHNSHFADNQTPDWHVGNLPKKRIFSRWKAASIHLFLSAVMAIASILLLYFMWYPQPFFEASGGEFLLKLLVAVDVVLGPLITLIIFNTQKKSLRFDLAVIGLVQLAALCYGMYTMYLARPVFAVYAHKQFKVVTANEIEADMLQRVTLPEFKSLSFTGPQFVFNEPPQSSPNLDDFMLSAEALAPQFYAPYAEKSSQVVKDGQPISALFQRRPEAKSLIDAELKKYGKSNEAIIFFPLIAKEKNLTVLADGKTGALISIVAVNPL